MKHTLTSKVYSQSKLAWCPGFLAGRKNSRQKSVRRTVAIHHFISRFRVFQRTKILFGVLSRLIELLHMVVDMGLFVLFLTKINQVLHKEIRVMAVCLCFVLDPKESRKRKCLLDPSFSLKKSREIRGFPGVNQREISFFHGFFGCKANFFAALSWA